MWLVLKPPYGRKRACRGRALETFRGRVPQRLLCPPVPFPLPPASADEAVGEASRRQRPVLLEAVEDGSDQLRGEPACSELAFELEAAVLAPRQQIEGAPFAG